MRTPVIFGIALALILFGAVGGGVYVLTGSAGGSPLWATYAGEHDGDARANATARASRGDRLDFPTPDGLPDADTWTAVSEAKRARGHALQDHADDMRAKAELARKQAAQEKREAASKARRAAERRAQRAARSASPAPTPSISPKVVETVSGLASYFGDESEYQPMACGGNSRDLTEGVALWEVPCGTMIRITSKETGRSVIAPVRDRGPAEWTGVAIDLLPDTWDALGVPRSQGKQEVTYEVLADQGDAP
ncbi:septal ring lytic transglycosylase RlpA family protein [Actinopolymorpha sp. B9G3]|uniref:septal ring lytic transglycosylase RlpA family protein n=1 Tax=Actinopolymorpha sp. B9G3 TaxID=3158970 RepID=UPI0032D8F7BC